MRILIAGGSGNVGKKLIPLLTAKGHEVFNLSRSPKTDHDIEWNPKKKWLDTTNIKAFDALINLAGYSVSNRWSKSNKSEMIDSRLNSNDTLLQYRDQILSHEGIWINASAIGIYGSQLYEQDENSPKGDGFLADLTCNWETFSQQLSTNIRCVILRIGIVLESKSGALEKMAPAFKWGLGAGLGNGQQWMSWIEINDLCSMFIHALENQNVRGVYNAVAPESVTQINFSKKLAQALNRPFFLPCIPSFVLHMLFGEMAQMLLNSQKISCSKIQKTGFEFQFPNLQSALQNQYNS
jgi:uncharacterized protein (TIGR01777 family)